MREVTIAHNCAIVAYLIIIPPRCRSSVSDFLFDHIVAHVEASEK